MPSTKHWPISLDLSDPSRIARLLLGLGYEQDNVVYALVDRCALDTDAAKRVVAEVAPTIEQGVSP